MQQREYNMEAATSWTGAGNRHRAPMCYCGFRFEIEGVIEGRGQWSREYLYKICTKCGYNNDCGYRVTDILITKDSTKLFYKQEAV